MRNILLILSFALLLPSATGAQQSNRQPVLKVIPHKTSTAASPSPHTPVGDGALAFIKAVYEAYTKGKIGRAPFRREDIYAANILALWSKAEAAEANAVDWQPLCGCQDIFSIASVTMLSSSPSSATARAELRDRPGDRPAVMQLQLIKETRGWRIKDVSDGRTQSLASLLLRKVQAGTTEVKGPTLKTLAGQQPSSGNSAVNGNLMPGEPGRQVSVEPPSQARGAARAVRGMFNDLAAAAAFEEGVNDYKPRAKAAPIKPPARTRTPSTPSAISAAKPTDRPILLAIYKDKTDPPCEGPDDPSLGSNTPPRVEWRKDLNGDGQLEALIIQDGTFCYGNTGTGFWLLTNDAKTGWTVLTRHQGAARFLAQKGENGMPDLEIGGPGLCFPVERWNGSKYVYNREHYNDHPCILSGSYSFTGIDRTAERSFLNIRFDLDFTGENVTGKFFSIWSTFSIDTPITGTYRDGICDLRTRSVRYVGKCDRHAFMGQSRDKKDRVQSQFSAYSQ